MHARADSRVLLFGPLPIALVVLVALGCQTSGQSKVVQSPTRPKYAKGESLDCGEARVGDGLAYAYRVAPEYPDRAMSNREHGFVEIGFDVDESGRPVELRVTRSSLGRRFDDAAMKAFRQWRLCPREFGREDLTVRFDFKLKPGPGSTAPADFKIRGF